MFHYVSPSNKVSIDVYRHTLFISINGPLNDDYAKETITAYRKAVSYLNDEFRYWGQILQIKEDISLTAEVATMFMHEDFNANTDNRKCCAIVVLPGNVKIDKNIELVRIYIPDTPVSAFDTIPQAMMWIDNFMTDYGMQQLKR